MLVIGFKENKTTLIENQANNISDMFHECDVRIVKGRLNEDSLEAALHEAYDGGHASVTVIAHPSILTEVDRMTYRYLDYFDEVAVLPESGFRNRLTEEEVVEDPIEEEAIQAEEVVAADVVDGISLIMITANPPLKGCGAVLKAAEELVKNKDEKYFLGIHSIGLTGQVMDAKLRGNLLFSSSNALPSLYGTNGLSGIKTSTWKGAKYYINSAEELSGLPKVTKVYAPKQALANLRAQMGEEVEYVELAGNSSEDPGLQQKALTMGMKIAKECKEVEQKEIKELDEKEAEQLAQENQQMTEVAETTPGDMYALYLISVCDKTANGAKLVDMDADKMANWFGKMNAADRAILDELGELTGIGDIASGLKDMGKVVGVVKDDTDKEKEDSKSLEGRQKAEEDRRKKVEERIKNFGFDTEAVKVHPEFAKFKAMFDIK